MTTIAIDGTTIAADGLRLWSSDIVQLDCEKIRVEGQAIYALAGTFGAFGPAIKWHQAGADPDAVPKVDDWTLFVLDQSGLNKYTKTLPYPEPMPVPIAFGSGCDQAMGAMMAGATAEEAVRIVSLVSVNTGGLIRVVDIASVIGEPLKAQRLFQPIQIAARAPVPPPPPAPPRVVPVQIIKPEFPAGRNGAA